METNIHLWKKNTFLVKPVLKYDDEIRRPTEKPWRCFFLLIFMSWMAYCQYVIHRDNAENVISNNSTATEKRSDLLPHHTYENIRSFERNVSDLLQAYKGKSIPKNISDLLLQKIEDISNGDIGTVKKNKPPSLTELEDVGIDENDKVKKYEPPSLTELSHFFVNVLTCNPTNLVPDFIKKQKSEKVSLGAHLVMSFIFLLSSLIFFIQDDKILSKQPLIIVAVFTFITLIEHLSIMFRLSNWFVSSSTLPYHEKLVYWVIPETIFFIILLSKIFSSKNYKNNEKSLVNDSVQNDNNNDSISGNASNNCNEESLDDVAHNSLEDECANKVADTYSNNETEQLDTDNSSVDNSENKNFEDDPKRDLTVYRIIPYYYYTYAFVFGFPFVIILKMLMTFTMSVLYKISWTSVYFYLILGGSFYVGQTVNYFGQMLTACATNMLIDRKKFSLKDLWRALYIVGRYHLGTVCYHAAPIMSNSEAHSARMKCGLKNDHVKYDSVMSKYCKYYRLSRVITATRGEKLFDSITELLRILAITEIRMHELFSSFGEINGLVFNFLISSNNLMNILFWYYGNYDAQFANASWVMYLSIWYMFYKVMEFFKTVPDTIGLRLCEKYVDTNACVDFGEV